MATVTLMNPPVSRMRYGWVWDVNSCAGRGGHLNRVHQERAVIDAALHQ